MDPVFIKDEGRGPSVTENTDFFPHVTGSVSMSRIAIFLLLLSFGSVSMLGHAGFHVLGLHSHCQPHEAHACGDQTPATQHHSCCHHHKQRHEDHRSHLPVDDSDDCVVCQLLALTKFQESQPPVVLPFSTRVTERVLQSNEVLLAFDFSLRPNPRGPPVPFV